MRIKTFLSKRISNGNFISRRTVKKVTETSYDARYDAMRKGTLKGYERRNAVERIRK